MKTLSSEGIFNKRNLLFACLTILLFRILVLVFFIDEINAIEDYAIAENIAEGKGFVYWEKAGPTALKAPIYPFFLSVFILIFGSYAKIAASATQHVIFSFVPFLLVALGGRVNLKKLGFLAGWLFLIHPSFFYYPNVLEAANIFIPLFIIWLNLAAKVKRQLKSSVAVLFGIISGVIILTQPIVAFLLLVFLVYIAFAKKTRIALISLAVSALILTPWSIRNYTVFDEFVFVKSPFWTNFYAGYLPTTHGSERYDVIEKADKRRIDALKIEGANNVELESVYKEIVINTISHNPLLYIEKCLFQAATYWWGPPKYLNDYSLKMIVGRKLPVLIINILSVLGLFILWKRNKEFAFTILVILIYFTLVYSLAHAANVRFKLDVEWLQLYLVAAALFKFTGNERLIADYD